MKKLLFITFIAACFTATITAQTAFKIEMVYVQGGTFTMGCTSEQRDCWETEVPAHAVTLNSFSIGKYEITQAQWRTVMDYNPSHFSDCDNCPVENVSWDDVQIFILKLKELTGKTYRLPTQAEWEYAARGGNKTHNYRYAGSLNDESTVAWYRNNSDKKTHPVGGKIPNELGIYDMSGNVDEWCSDWFSPIYYSNSPSSNPQGSIDGVYRVVRGGNWTSNDWNCRVSRIDNQTPYYKTDYIGFRLVLESY